MSPRQEEKEWSAHAEMFHTVQDPGVPYGKLFTRQLHSSIREDYKEEMDFTFFINVQLIQLNSIIMSSGNI